MGARRLSEPRMDQWGGGAGRGGGCNCDSVSEREKYAETNVDARWGDSGLENRPPAITRVFAVFTPAQESVLRPVEVEAGARPPKYFGLDAAGTPRGTVVAVSRHGGNDGADFKSWIWGMGWWCWRGGRGHG